MIKIRMYADAQDFGNGLSCGQFECESIESARARLKTLGIRYIEVCEGNSRKPISINSKGEFLLLGDKKKHHNGEWLLFYHLPKTIIKDNVCREN